MQRSWRAGPSSDGTVNGTVYGTIYGTVDGAVDGIVDGTVGLPNILTFYTLA